MNKSQVDSAPRTIGPDGSLLTLDNLPPPQTERWVVRRKAEVVLAVRDGLLSIAEACARYSISKDEFLSWAQAFQCFGLNGLRTLRAQSYVQGSHDLGVHQTALRHGVKGFADDPRHSFAGHGQMKPEQFEIARLKREVAKLKAERDILRKAR